MILSFQLDFQHSLGLVGLKEDHRVLIAEVVPHQVYVGVLVKVHESYQQILAFLVLAASLLRAR